MKILNKQKTHFLKSTKCGLYQIKYDTVENVNLIINNILNNCKPTKINHSYTTSAIKDEPG